MDTAEGILTDDQTRQILQSAKTIAIIGWSDKEERPSHSVANYLRRQGYHIIPVNPRLAGTTWDGEPVYASITDIAEHIDIVDVFRRPSATPGHAREAVEVGADVLWLQMGVINDEAGGIARSAGLTYIEDRCTQVEHLRLIKGLG